MADIAAEDREFLSDPTGRVVLGLDGTGEPAGFATVCDGPQRWELQFEPDLQPERELVKLYVLEHLHGSGLGGRLLDEAVDGHDPVYLWIMAGNARAEAFYAKNGFERIGPAYQADGPWAGQETFRMRRVQGLAD